MQPSYIQVGVLIWNISIRESLGLETQMQPLWPGMNIWLLIWHTQSWGLQYETIMHY